MNKVPVQKTIVAAYGFLFAHIGKIAAIAGLPSLIFVAADYATHIYASTNHAALDARDPQATAAYLAVTATASLVMLLARAMAAFGIVREAFGARPGFHPLDRVLWRMFAADIRFWLGALALAAIVVLIAVLGFMLAGVPLATDDSLQPTPAAVLAGIVAWVVFIYALITMLRMGFLLPAVVAAEEKGGLVRAHELAHGNVWRLLAIGLALGLPIFVLLVTAEAAIVGTSLGPDVIAQGNPAAMMQIAEEAIDQRLIPWEIYNAIVFILYSGLFYGGAVYAYRALVPGRNPIPAKTV